MQHYLGSQENFFYGKFTTDKDPDDLAEFYQAEDLLKIISVHPIIFNLLMNKVDPDTKEPQEDTALLSLEETHFNVKLFGMEVSFEIIEHEEEVDGEMRLKGFERHERFIDWVPLLADYGHKVLMWDQTWTYGFNTLEDGKVEVYHHGEKFAGPWIIRLGVFIHQYYVLWACQRYINGDAFGTEDLDKQQEQLACVPLHVFKEFVHKLRAEKERELEDLKNDPTADGAAIIKATETVAKLKQLSDSKQSTISVAKRKGVSGSVTAPLTVKMVVSDQATREALSDCSVKVTRDALSSAFKSVQVKTDKSVNIPVKEEFEFQPRPSVNKRLLKTQTVKVSP